MSDLFAAVCSIAPTRRRRYLWAVWWSAPPTAEPFRKPDAYAGGARTPADALREAERVAARPLVAIESRWARAWARVLMGQPPWARRRRNEERIGTAREGSRSERTTNAPDVSAWAILGVRRDATVAEIKRAYRQRALETHPDRGGDADAFRSVHRAYERALGRRANPKRRKR